VKIRLSILSLFFAVTGTFITPNATAGDTTTAAPRDTAQLKLASGSSLLLDMQTNKIIYASNPDVVVPIASVSKLITGLVVV
jgi:D-alanyl-D-alanine endopeptidase (penicillin-binding protein 7)